MDMQAIDFQIVRRGRPTIDLCYMLTTSTNTQFRHEHRYEIIDAYHKKLVENLVDFGYSKDLYPYAQFKQDVKDCFVFGYAMGSMHAQVT